MAHQGGEDVYATLLISDTYLPGALVLAHSLRDAVTSKKLAVLVTLDTVSPEVVTQLENVFDYVIPVPRIQNETSPDNLHLMNRPDLHSAFTKINLWKLTQFRKIVYIDADIVAYRAPDELFNLPHTFAAAPDIGWPDLFNTGVMVLTPDLGKYQELVAMAQNGESFDGADQGLLNMHFEKSYHRLPFIYNVTPSAHYQYLPAYRHFKSDITMVHFIGSDKPWMQGRSAYHGGGAYDELVGQWWAVYDLHYRPVTTPSNGSNLSAPPPPPEIVQYFVKGEFNPTVTYRLSSNQPSWGLGRSAHGQHSETHPLAPLSPQLGHNAHGSHGSHGSTKSHEHPPLTTRFTTFNEETRAETQNQPPAPEHKNEPYRPPMEHSWDAQWQPPPSNSRPEAMNFPQTHYEMSRDTTPFVPPSRYASPPRDMWYQVPSSAPTASHHRPAPIFPWENNQPAPTRVFFEPPPPPSPSEPDSVSSQAQSSSPSVDLRTEPTTPTMPSSDPWASFTRSNAWDEVPQIERYVDAFQKQHRRVRSRGQVPGGGVRATSTGSTGSTGSTRTTTRTGTSGMTGDGAEDASSTQRRGSKVTDFPTEAERPSLPVTPAPIRRPKNWGSGGPNFAAGGHGDDGDDEKLLPAADGVPQQVDWDPSSQLQKLAKEQSKMLLQKLGHGDEEGGDAEPKTIPLRPLPHGSEGIQSPTYVAQAPVMSPKPIKPGGHETSSVRNIYSGADSSTSSYDDSHGATTMPSFPDTKIAEPAYHGPGIVFEKDEVYPEHEMTAALPSEEERDVLDT